jgi:hypothetical protein
MDVLKDALVHLITYDPYYAELIYLMNVSITDKVPTAGVSITDNINLYINPHFFRTLSIKEKTAVLRHECGHIINDHINREKELPDFYNEINIEISNVIEGEVDKEDIENDYIKQVNHKQANIAADFAINEYTYGIFDEMIHLDQQYKPILDDNGKFKKVESATVDNYIKQTQDQNIKRNQTMEYYYDYLRKNSDSKQNIKITIVGDHEIWKESNNNKEYNRIKIKHVLNKALKNLKENKGIGSVPDHIQTAINNLVMNLYANFLLKLKK